MQGPRRSCQVQEAVKRSLWCKKDSGTRLPHILAQRVSPVFTSAKRTSCLISGCERITGAFPRCSLQHGFTNDETTRVRYYLQVLDIWEPPPSEIVGVVVGMPDTAQTSPILAATTPSLSKFLR
jgi:hypothetical protein